MLLKIDRDEWEYGRYIPVIEFNLSLIRGFVLGLGVFQTFYHGFQPVCAFAILQLFLLQENQR